MFKYIRTKIKLKFIIPLLLLLSSHVYSQSRDSVWIKEDIFEILYSEKIEGPLLVKYEVQCSDGSFSRKGLDFYTNDSIHTSDGLDYINNIYDKGHMAPAADFNCDSVKLRKTFSYLNCSPQDQYLNRGTWRLLEEYERALKKKCKNVTVTITPKYSSKSIKLGSGATVPDGYQKIINADEKIYKFYFPNSKPKTSDFMMYLVR